jgi:hypothetical protein
MATQGLVTVTGKSEDKVLMKIVAGCNGFNAQKFAYYLRESWPVNASDVYHKALELGLGCYMCLVVISDIEVYSEDVGELSTLYRETFQQPKFNPRWKNGTADFIVVVEV